MRNLPEIAGALEVSIPDLGANYVAEENEGEEPESMAKCEVCGNDYDKAFQVNAPGEEPRTFDSFECAIHALAPSCEHCGVKVIGHGVEADGSFYCCAHCARMAGATEAQDRA